MLGFEAHLIVPGEADGIVAHAQLTLGNGMIMLAAGALIVMDLAEQDYGGKLYACRDPEGQLWNIGSYDPWGGAQG